MPFPRQLGAQGRAEEALGPSGPEEQRRLRLKAICPLSSAQPICHLRWPSKVSGRGQGSPQQLATLPTSLKPSWALLALLNCLLLPLASFHGRASELTVTLTVGRVRIR